LLLPGWSRVSAQEFLPSFPPSTATPEATTAAGPPQTALPPEKVEFPTASCSDGCQDDEKAKPFWAKNPPVTRFPRPGFFCIPPTGPGYYSAWDLLQGNERENPPKFPYGPIGPTPFSFFNADFRYLDDPQNTQTDWLDCTKRIHFGDNWLLSFGGEE